jgi:hypothetical protein
VEVSFDRLGERGIDRKVLNFVTPIARRQGEAFRTLKKFGGWAYIQAAQLANPPKGAARFPVQPSPIKLDAPQDAEHNPYHAHATGEETHSVALHLQFLFSNYGKIRECPGGQSKALGRAKRLWVSLLRWRRLKD